MGGLETDLNSQVRCFQNGALFGRHSPDVVFGQDTPIKSFWHRSTSAVGAELRCIFGGHCQSCKYEEIWRNIVFFFFVTPSVWMQICQISLFCVWMTASKKGEREIETTKENKSGLWRGVCFLCVLLASLQCAWGCPQVSCFQPPFTSPHCRVGGVLVSSGKQVCCSHTTHVAVSVIKAVTGLFVCQTCNVVYM